MVDCLPIHSHTCYSLPIMDDLWSIERVADYLGVSRRTVYNKVRTGDLPAIKVGRSWRFRQSDLEMWLDKNRQDGQPHDHAVPEPGKVKN